jgi:tripartite ATP-independent transporter DctM subunit
MGTIIFESGVGLLMVNAVDKWMGSFPGRLSLIAVGAGTLLGTMTGVSTGSVAILGKGLVPEMNKQGYHRVLSIGPIVGSGTLATMIPPTMLGVFLGAVGQISIGRLLIAILIPGLLMAILFALFIIIACLVRPSIAPAYKVAKTPMLEKLKVFVTDILPVGIVIFAVIGVILLGIATPSESAALGVLSCFLLAAVHRKLDWQVLKRTMISSMETNLMIFAIVAGAISFSRILAFSGAMSGLVGWAVNLQVAPIIIIIFSQLVILFMGMFMGPNSIMMITLPIYMPIVNALGFDPVWFGVITLINVQLGLISPPFGMDCFVMKGVLTDGTTLAEVFKAAMPFMAVGVFTSVLVMFYPQIALWLPGLMN